MNLLISRWEAPLHSAIAGIKTRLIKFPPSLHSYRVVFLQDTILPTQIININPLVPDIH